MRFLRVVLMHAQITAKHSASHPWDFGILPSEYHSLLCADQKQRLGMDTSSMRRMDDIYRASLSIPNARKLVLPKIIDFSIKRDYPELMLAPATASYCKPMSTFGVSDKIYSNVITTLSNAGLATKDCGPDTCQKHISILAAAASKKILGAFGDAKKLPENERHFAHGLLYGFPVGDVFSWILEYKNPDFMSKVYTHRGLFHKTYPHAWAPDWRNEVGFSGLERMKKAYYSFMTDFPSFEDSPFSSMKW